MPHSEALVLLAWKSTYTFSTITEEQKGERKREKGKQTGELQHRKIHTQKRSDLFNGFQKLL